MQFDWDPPPGAYPTDPLPSVDDSVIGTDSPAAQGVVERLLLFPTYARLSLTPQQAIHAAQIKKAVATIPSTPPVADTSTDPSTQPPVDNVNVPTNGPALFELKESIQTALIENVQSTGCPDNPGEEPDRAWLVNFKGWAYATREQSRRRKILLGLSRRFLASNTVDDTSRSLHDERAGLFLANSVRNLELRVMVVGLAPSQRVLARRGVKDSKPIGEIIDNEEELEEDEVARFDDQQWKDLETSDHGITVTTDASGFFSGTIHLPAKIVDKWRQEKPVTLADHDYVRVVAFKVGQHSLHSLGSVELISPTGLSVISDVDDTIKDSSVHEGRMAAINAALFAEAKEVAGMADAYNYLRGKHVSIHYVSASPHQLYPMLSAFLKTSRFPPGSLNLRNIWERGEDRSSTAYKRKVITKILQDFPDRKFILVGDSGEQDIETYATLHSIAPDQIIKIFIRDVNSHKHPPIPKARTFPFVSRESPGQVPGQDIVNPLVARARAAFASMQRDGWSLFKQPEKIFTDSVVTEEIWRMTELLERLPLESEVTALKASQ